MATDSFYVLHELSGLKNIELIILGGSLERDGNTFNSLLAVEAAKKIQVDCCYFSVFVANYPEENVS